jgi:hypothetical protein
MKRADSILPRLREVLNASKSEHQAEGEAGWRGRLRALNALADYYERTINAALETA